MVPFYDVKNKCNRIKARPVLIIGEQRNNDYTVLPVSSVTKRENLDLEYDIEISPQKYPAINIDHTSYVRTHKQMPIHKASLGREIADIKKVYPNLFREILAKKEQWNKLLDVEALNF